MRGDTPDIEDGAKRLPARECGQPLYAGRGKDVDSHLESPEEIALKKMSF